MLVHLRRAASVVVIALVLGPLLFVTPSQAYSLADWSRQLRDRAAALRVPGSTITAAMPGGSSDPTVSVRRIAGVQRSAAAGARGVTLVPSDAITSVTDPLSPRKAGVKALGAAGTAITAAYGVDLIYSNATGHGLAGSLGFGGIVASDSSSGSLVCDLQQLFLSDRTCALGPAQDYVLNSDVGDVTPEGWPLGNKTPSRDIPAVGYTAWSAGLDVVVTSGTYPSASLSFSGRQFVASGTYTGSQYTSGGGLSIQGFCVSSGGSFSAQSPSGESWTPATGLGSGQATTTGFVTERNGVFTIRCGQGAVVDHFEIYSPFFSAGPNGSDGWQNRRPWYPPGHQKWVPGGEADPARTWVTTWRCSDGSTGSATGDPWRETDPEWPGPLSPSCTSGSLTYVLVQQTAVGLDPWTLYEWSAPDALSDYAAAYPQCADAACVLELHRVDAATGTQLACFDNPEACAQWFEDPARSTNYVCTYGGAAVDLSECYVYAPTFDPATRTDAGPAYADPATGTTPSTGTTPGQDPSTGCPPPFEFTLGGLGYWVTKGTSCALEWAFVPSAQRVSVEVAATRDAVATRPPFSLFATVEPVFGGLGSGWSSACSGRLTDFDPEQRGRLAIPCAPPASPAFSTLYAVAVMAVIASTGFAVWHMLVAALGGNNGETGAS